jgi:hypothetical protein
LKFGEEFFENALTFKGWRWVAVVEATVIGRDDLILRLDHFGINKSLNGVLEEVGMINWLHGRFGDFQHDGPIRTLPGLAGFGLAFICEILSWELDRLIWLVVWRIVGENSGTVEGAVVLGEVELREG